MPLTTTDIALDFDSGWMAVPCTGSIVHIVRVSNADIEVRVGISSTSGGFVVKQGDTVKSSETLYVRPYIVNGSGVAKITVVKD